MCPALGLEKWLPITSVPELLNRSTNSTRVRARLQSRSLPFRRET
jgi:hypothetical protein